MIISPIKKEPLSIDAHPTNGAIETSTFKQDAPASSPQVASQQRASSSLISRNVTVKSHRTSVRLEPEMWSALRELCMREHLSIHDIATAVSERKPANTSLTAALRVFIMAYFRAAATEDGHSKAGHGPGGAFMSSWGRPSVIGSTTKMRDFAQPMRRFTSIVTR